MKKCKICLEEKELFLFDKISKSGYRGTCRKCRNKKNTTTYLEKEGNIEKRREYMREYMNDKYNNSDEYRAYQRIISKIKYEIRKEPLKSIFELKFIDDMNWENYGTYWEIDHIIPALKMIKLGYSDEEINDIKNIRPLKIMDNRERQKKESNQYNDYKESPSKKKYNKIWMENNKEYMKQYKKEYYLKNLTKS